MNVEYIWCSLKRNVKSNKRGKTATLKPYCYSSGNLQQPLFVGRQVWTWVIKRATSFFNTYCSNVQNELHVFIARFTVALDRFSKKKQLRTPIWPITERQFEHQKWGQSRSALFARFRILSWRCVAFATTACLLFLEYPIVRKLLSLTIYGFLLFSRNVCHSGRERLRNWGGFHESGTQSLR